LRQALTAMTTATNTVPLEPNGSGGASCGDVVQWCRDHMSHRLPSDYGRTGAVETGGCQPMIMREGWRLREGEVDARIGQVPTVSLCLPAAVDSIVVWIAPAVIAQPSGLVEVYKKDIVTLPVPNHDPGSLLDPLLMASKTPGT
jgi:hypothetical protein